MTRSARCASGDRWPPGTTSTRRRCSRRPAALGRTPVGELQRSVSPDFHHTPDLEGAGRLLDFLPPAAAEASSLHGDAGAVATQLTELLRALPVFEIVVLHPVPDPAHQAPGAPPDYMGLVAREVLPRVRAAVGGPRG